MSPLWGEEAREIETSQYRNTAVCTRSHPLGWLTERLSSQMQTLGIRAQFWKGKQTRWNICLFARTKENVNMVNGRLQLLYMLRLAPWPPGVEQHFSVTGKTLPKETDFLTYFKTEATAEISTFDTLASDNSHRPMENRVFP